MNTLQAASTVQELSTKLEEAQRAFNAADSELKRIQQILQRHKAWETGIDRRLEELGLERITTRSNTIEILELMIRDLAKTIQTTTIQRQNGERIALRLARASEQARRAELSMQIDQLRQEVQRQEKLLLLRERTSTTANRLIEALREAASDFVEVELKRIEPLVQRIFSTIDPHPTFQIVNLLSTFSYRSGRITTQIGDRVTGYRSDTPAALMSSSQLNALAVSIFLALNLGVTNPPLRTTLLDDPLQSLDDVNLLGVVDLLRRASEFRQILVTTHDDRFGHLLERKLRPIGKDRRTRVIEFLGWTREGPEVYQRDVPADTGGLRIAA